MTKYAVILRVTLDVMSDASRQNDQHIKRLKSDKTLTVQELITMNRESSESMIRIQLMLDLLRKSLE